MRYYVTVADGKEVTVDLTTRPDGRTEVCVDDKPVATDIIEAGGAINVRVGDRVFDLWLDDDGESIRFTTAGHRGRALVESDRSRTTSASLESATTGARRVTAPMPGRVVKILVQVGDRVEAGDAVVVVEAMKMENELAADGSGVVTKILVQADENVTSGDVLVELGPVEDTA